MTWRSRFLAIIVCSLIQPTTAQVIINEVMYDPVGADAGKQLVELKNIGTVFIDLSGWWLCARQDYAGPFPDVTLAPGALIVCHIGAAGTDSKQDLYFPFMLPMQTISDFNLYLNPIFSNPSSMVSFVQWGGVPPVNRQTEAVTAGLWTAGDFVPLVPEGHSMEYDGSGKKSTDWYDQPNPSIGKENVRTGVKASGAVPAHFALLQNFPNPLSVSSSSAAANPSTQIRFQLAAGGQVDLSVFNLLGQKVATVFRGALPEGKHELPFQTSGLPAGVYFYKLEMNGRVAARRMILQR